ncbi:transmembrane protein, putative (macronuclear) [Tetrahymena thermophila SB210]|uniref:Transmembrane protein, putative n=1 Tax=Tetrahymena thermophila (strain SB210) TaxID=312017 RepID=I7MK19_TETTS|nr:transmembrane protein, putative [Tetrahymena thermophila SB210]EAR97422.2 transmembrane protein, putative [Tetrahymena thermophila SB210]|eukprot:XP_001017667.2 transmembrane protein, putative [Tetrahymena thermophila SB210]
MSNEINEQSVLQEKENNQNDKREEERLKQIQNIVKVNTKELDSYLQLNFFQKHGNDIIKISESLEEYQGIIRDSIKQNYKRGYVIWINLKGLVFTLIYLLSKIDYTFQIDIYDKISEIKQLIFNNFWASEIQELEEYQILKLCLVILIFQRQASSINDIIFEYDNYKALLQEQFEVNVLQKQYNYSCLYLYKIYTAVAFSMQYKKYDIKEREKVFDLGLKIFQYIQINNLNQQYILEEKDEFKWVHCYFEFLQKYFKLLQNLDGKQQKAFELIWNSLKLLEIMSKKLNQDYYLKIKQSFQKFQQQIQSKIKDEMVQNEYLIERDSQNQSYSLQSNQDGDQIKKIQSAQNQHNDNYNKESSNKNIKLSLESIQKYSKQLALKKFSALPKKDQQSPLKQNSFSQINLLAQRKIAQQNEQRLKTAFSIGSKGNLQTQVSFQQLGIGSHSKSQNKIKTQENLANVTFQIADIGKRVMTNQIQLEGAANEEIEQKTQNNILQQMGFNTTNTYQNKKTSSLKDLLNQIHDCKKNKNDINQESQSPLKLSNSKYERIRASSGGGSETNKALNPNESMKSNLNTLDQYQRNNFEHSPTSQTHLSQDFKKFQINLHRPFDSNNNQTASSFGLRRQPSIIQVKQQFYSRQNSMGSLNIDEIQQNKSQDLHIHLKRQESIQNQYPISQKTEHCQGQFSFQEQGDEQANLLPNYNQAGAFTFGLLSLPTKNQVNNNNVTEDPTPKMKSLQQSLQGTERKRELSNEYNQIANNKIKRNLKSRSLHTSSDQSFQKSALNRLNEKILSRTLSNKQKQFIPKGVFQTNEQKNKFINTDETLNQPTTTIGLQTTQNTIPNYNEDKSLSIYSTSTDVAKIYRSAITSIHSQATSQNTFKGKNRNSQNHQKSRSIHYAFGSASNYSSQANSQTGFKVGVFYVPNKSFQYNYLMQPQLKTNFEIQRQTSKSFHQNSQIGLKNNLNSQLPAENASAVFLQNDQQKDVQNSNYNNNVVNQQTTQEKPKELTKAQQQLILQIKQTEEIVKKQREEMKKTNQKIIQVNNYTLEISDDSYFNQFMPSISNIHHYENSDSNRVDDLSLSQMKQYLQNNKQDQNDQEQINSQNANAASNPNQQISKIFSNQQLDQNNISSNSIQSLPFNQIDLSQIQVNNPIQIEIQTSSILSTYEQQVSSQHLFRRVSSNLEIQMRDIDKAQPFSQKDLQVVEEQAEENQQHNVPAQKIKDIQKLDSLFRRQYSSKRLTKLNNLQNNVDKNEQQKSEQIDNEKGQQEDTNQAEGQFLIKDFFNDSSKIAPKNVMDSQQTVSPLLLFQQRNTEIKFIESPAISQAESNETKPSIIVRNMEGDVIEKHSNLSVLQNGPESQISKQNIIDRQLSLKEHDKALEQRLGVFQKYLNKKNEEQRSKSQQKINKGTEKQAQYQKLQSYKIMSLENIEDMSLNDQRQQDSIPNPMIDSLQSIQDISVKRKEPMKFQTLTEEQLLEDLQTPQTQNQINNPKKSISGFDNITHQKKFTFNVDVRNNQQFFNTNSDQRVYEDAISPILMKSQTKNDIQTMQNYDEIINPIQSTSILNQDLDDSKQKISQKDNSQENNKIFSQQKIQHDQFFLHSKSLEPQIDGTGQQEQQQIHNQEEKSKNENGGESQSSTRPYIQPLQFRRVFNRNSIRHQSQQNPSTYHQGSDLFTANKFKNKKRASFIQFLKEEQKKQILQNVNEPQTQENITYQSNNQFSQSGDQSYDSQNKHPFQRKVTNASNNSEQVFGTIDGKLKIPLVQMDYDFDRYSEIQRESTPFSYTRNENLANTNNVDVNSNKNIYNTQAHTTSNIYQQEEVSSFNHGLNTIIEQPSQLKFGGAQMFNKMLNNFELDSNNNTKQKRQSFSQTYNTTHPQHFSDAVQNAQSSLQQQLILTSPALTSNSTNSIPNYNIYNTSINLNANDSNILNRLQAQTISSKPGNTSRAKANESIRRLSIQSNQMLSQQQISLSSFNEILKKEESLKGKPHLQILLGQLQLDKRNQEILQQITSQKRLTIKNILASIDTKEPEPIQKASSEKKNLLMRSKRSYSNISQVGRKEQIQEEQEEIETDQGPQPVTTNNRQVIQRQRSLFYKQQQEQLNKLAKNQDDSMSSQISQTEQKQSSSQTSIIRGNNNPEQNESLSSSQDESKYGDTQKKLLADDLKQSLEQKENQNFQVLRDFKERSKKKKSSRFMQYKLESSSEVIEDQPSVSKNLELTDQLSVSSEDRSGSNTPDFTQKNKQKKKSTFSEALQLAFQGDKRSSVSQQNQEETIIFSSEKSPSSRFLYQEDINEIAERDFIENIQIEENVNENQFELFRQKSIKNALAMKIGKDIRDRKNTSQEEDIQQPFLPNFKFVRFVSGKPMVISVMYQIKNIPKVLSTLKNEIMNGNNENDVQINGIDYKQKGDQESLNRSISISKKPIIQEFKQVNRIIMKLNDNQIFAKKESEDVFIAQIDLEIDQDVQNKFYDLQKNNLSRKESSNQNDSNLQTDEKDYKTIWPLFNFAFEIYLKKRLPKVYTIPDPHSDDEEKKKSSSISKYYSRVGKKKIKDVISQYKMFIERPDNTSDLVTEIDLKNIGSVKDKINQLIKHYGKRIRKEMGYSFYISDQDQTNSLVMVSLRKQIDKSNRIYSNLVPFYSWDLSNLQQMKKNLYMEGEVDKSIKLQTSCLKEPSYRKTENYIISRHIKYLSQRILKIIQSPPIIFTFFKKDEAQKLYQITVKISFKPGSENIKNSTFTNFSFYILGKNMKTLRNSIQPLDLHVEEIIENDPQFSYIYKIISRFAIYDRIPRQWTEYMIKYFDKLLIFRSSDRYMRSNYDYKLESVYQIVKKQQQFDKEYRFIDQIEKKTKINNLILKNILFKEQISRENFQTIFDEKFNEAYAQYSSQIRFNILDIEEMLYDGTKDLKEVEIEFIKQVSKKFTGLEKAGPRVENVTQQDMIDNSASHIIQQQKITNYMKKEMETIVRRITEQFKKNQKSDIFCNKKSLRVIVMNLKESGRKFWVYLQTNGQNLVLFVKCQRDRESYKYKIKNWKQKELILNIFKTKQTHPNTCYTNLEQRNYHAYRQVYQQIQQQSKQDEYVVRNVLYLRDYLIKNFFKRQITSQGFRLVPTKFNENNLKNNLNLDSLNTVKDHLLLSQKELLRYYLEITSCFVRNIKSLGKTTVILKAYRLGNDVQSKLDGLQCLFLFSLIPYESRTKIFKFVMNYLDVVKLNQKIGQQILNNFDLNSISKLIDFIISSFSVLKTYIGSIPIFSYIEKEQIVGNERQVYYSIVKKDSIRLHKVQKLYPQLSAKDIFKKVYNINSSFRNSNSNFNNRRRSDQIKVGTMKFRYFQNKFYKDEYEFSKHNKNNSFLEDSSFSTRIIFQQPKLFGTDWGLVTILKDIQAQQWSIKIYIPKTSRTLNCKISNSNFERCSSEFIMQCITNQLMFFNDNPKFQSFQNFIDFEQRMKARFYNIGSNNSALSIILNPIIKKNFCLLPNPNNKFKLLVQKYKHILLENSQPKYADTSKLNSVKKIYKINKFLDLTKKMDDSFQMHLYDYRQLFLQRFIEIWIWQMMLKKCHFRINHQNLDLYMHFGSTKLSINELVLYSQYKLNETNEFQTEIYIDLIKGFHSLQRQKPPKDEDRKEFTNTRKALVDHYFNNMDYLAQESTSKFNFHLINYSIRTQTTKVFDINLREILNLYIAEGFSKLHTGYTSSKVTYNDLRELCSFIIFKIRTQNFLDLAINENVTVRAKQISVEKKTVERQNTQSPRKNGVNTEQKNLPRVSIISNIMNNPKNKNNFVVNEKKKSLFAASNDKSSPNSQSSNSQHRKSIVVRHRQSIFDPNQKKVNFNVVSNTEGVSSPGGQILGGIKRVDSDLSKFSNFNKRNSIVGSFKSDSEYYFNMHTINQNSTDLDESRLSEKSSIFIYDSIIDIKNRIMIRSYFYTNDETFVIKIFQCGSGFAFTRFLNISYFAKKDGFFLQYLKAELYEEIIKRATRTIKLKMYVYFCIQHKIAFNQNIILS